MGKMPGMPAKKPPRSAPTFLKKWRLSRRLTLEQVGNMLGVGSQAVHKWEAGKTPVDLDRLRQLAEIYETTTDALLFDPVEGELVQKMREAYFILRKLPAEDAAKWLGVGEAMTGERQK